MKEKTIEEQITELMQVCGFGTVLAPIAPVSGGFMHRMYRVETEQGIFAVKHLNPEIMRRPDAMGNYEQAERLEGLLEQAGLPIVPALVVHGKKMQQLVGQYFYIFRWQEGHITDWNNISAKECRMAGEILGQMHAIDPKNVPHEEPEVSDIHWQDYVCRAKEEQSGIASLLEENVSLLIYAQEELNRARAALPDVLCVSNEDMDPKNVMWDNGTPWAIDLECLSYGNPISHVLQLALQWAGSTNCAIKLERMVAFFEGYLEKYDNCFRGYGNVFGLSYTWVEWLEYNIQRALGACVDEVERQMGISEVKNTIARIAYLRSMEEEIKEALGNRLPRVKAARFDNHDERICYYELLLEGDITEVENYELPDGYRIVPYTDGDRDTWISIEQSAKEFTSYEQGMAAWERYYGAKEKELLGRMFFVETEMGEKVATATAFYDIHGRDTSGDGWLHWVAVKREHQGKGLSKPLITYVLRVMHQLGHVRAKIPTQTNTWLACKVYLDLGFVPVEKNKKRNAEGWRMIEALTGVSIL